MQFNALLAAATDTQMEFPQGWGQGRATYGGLVAALMYQHLVTKVPGRHLRSLTINFVGPVAPGAVKFEAEILREGKSVTQAQVRLYQDEVVQAILLASFGEPRESAISVDPSLAPSYRAPDQLMALPFVAGVTPDFLQHFNVHWGEGNFPFMGGQSSSVGGWEKFADVDGPLTAAHVLALVDVWPPTVLGMMKKPAPSSSMTWTLEMVAELDGLHAADWYQYQASTDFAAHGYVHSPARLWDASGRLLAISRQTVVVFG